MTLGEVSSACENITRDVVRLQSSHIQLKDGRFKHGAMRHESYGRYVGDGQACGSSTPVAAMCSCEHGQRRHCRDESTRRRTTTISDSRSPEVTSDDQGRQKAAAAALRW